MGYSLVPPHLQNLLEWKSHILVSFEIKEIIMHFPATAARALIIAWTTFKHEFKFLCGTA